MLLQVISILQNEFFRIKSSDSANISSQYYKVRMVEQHLTSSFSNPSNLKTAYRIPNSETTVHMQNNEAKILNNVQIPPEHMVKGSSCMWKHKDGHCEDRNLSPRPDAAEPWSGSLGPSQRQRCLLA